MTTMRLRASSTPVLLAVCIWSSSYAASGAEVKILRDATMYGDSVVGLYRDGSVGVWNAQGGEFDPNLSAALSKKSFSRIASDGKRIWGVEGTRLYAWSSGAGTWEEVAGFDAEGEDLAAVTIVGGVPLLIFPSRVKSPTEGRSFDVPRLKGQLDLKTLRVLAVQPMDRVLWVGTGNGEWGGHLVGLDVRTGRWVQFYDAFHYVTGIT